MSNVTITPGLGLPWLVASIYWEIRNPEVGFKVQAGGLEFSTSLYLVISILGTWLLHRDKDVLIEFMFRNLAHCSPPEYRSFWKSWTRRTEWSKDCLRVFPCRSLVSLRPSGVPQFLRENSGIVMFESTRESCEKRTSCQSAAVATRVQEF